MAKGGGIETLSAFDSYLQRAVLKFTGDSDTSVTLTARAVPFEIPCFEISKPSIGIIISHLCSDQGDGDKLQYECVNGDIEITKGVCISTANVICSVLSDVNIGPLYACGSFDRWAVLALVNCTRLIEEEQGNGGQTYLVATADIEESTVANEELRLPRHLRSSKKPSKQLRTQYILIPGRMKRCLQTMMFACIQPPMSC